MVAENEVIFPRTLSDIYPMAAQEIYIKTYKQSWARSGEAAKDSLSRESVASRDAWDAVWREYMQDAVTHKWHRIDDRVAASSSQTGKRSFISTVKGMFKR
jgi:cation transport regulator ChaB